MILFSSGKEGKLYKMALLPTGTIKDLT